MSRCTFRRWMISLPVAACALLCGCSGQLDESILTQQADYSVNISLPYATVTPLPAVKEETAALVIDSEGSVTVNDSTTILAGEAQSDTQSNYKSLRQGNTGLAVQALQTRLQELGYFTEEVSGIFDTETEAAVRRFEQTYGTMQTGVATVDFQERLFASDAIVYASEAYNEAVVSQYTILQRGDVGSSVYALQQRLKNLNYPISELSGIFDNETANAVMLFYESYGLTASEIANVAMQKELYSDSAKAYGDAVEVGDSLSILDDELVVQIQERLIELGYLSGEADGIQDDAMQLAIRLFEEACGQLPSGSISEDFQTMLFSENAPSFNSLSSAYTNLLEGSSGDAVKQLQTRLVDLGFATGTPNGEYGEATTASVKLFQKSNALEETGVATRYVQAVLFSSFARNIDGEMAISALPAATAEPEATPEPEASSSAVSDTLQIGSSGDAVLRLQNRLTELGFVSSVTGTYDDITGRAVTALQSIIGCDPDGIADIYFLRFIYSSAAPNSSQIFHSSVQPYHNLSPEDSGDEVTQLQKRLWELGYLAKNDVKDSVGTFNEATQQAVIQLQTDLGYEDPDGVASVELQCYLYSDYSRDDED